MLGFWVVEDRKKGKEFAWWFEHELEDVDGLAERLDLVARGARCFFVEKPLPEEARKVLLRISPYLSPKAQILVQDLLV